MRTICFSARMFALFLCLIAIGGCHSGNNDETTDGIVARSSLARDINPQVSDADLAAVVGGNTDFALKAFGQIGTGADTNTVFSP